MNKSLIICILPLFLLGQNIKGPVEYNESVARQKAKLINKIFLSDTIHIVVTRSGCFNHNVVYDYLLTKKGSHYVGTYSVTKLSNPPETSHQQVLKMGQSTLQSIHELFLYGLKIQEGSCTTKKKFTLSSPNNTVFFNDDRCDEIDGILEKLVKIISDKNIN
ncbi:MAG: hypothetical protein V4677_15145 [Bacteroidota bacterium]